VWFKVFVLKVDLKLLLELFVGLPLFKTPWFYVLCILQLFNLLLASVKFLLPLEECWFLCFSLCIENGFSWLVLLVGLSLQVNLLLEQIKIGHINFIVWLSVHFESLIHSFTSNILFSTDSFLYFWLLLGSICLWWLLLLSRRLFLVLVQIDVRHHFGWGFSFCLWWFFVIFLRHF